MLFNKKSFTLIELIVVIKIVGVLAAVSVPIMQSIMRKAITTEALAAMGAIRTAERLYYVEHGRYQVVIPSY